MTQETFLNYANWKWLRISVAIVVLAVVWYFIDSPLMPKSGSTFYGYSVGILSALMMIYLLWYGARKRAYFSELTTLKEVLSAHTWIGIALLILVPLHSGFSFHWNVHTIAFIFCVLTIITGIWGVFLYRALPERIKSNRGEGSMKNLLEQFDSLEQLLRKMESGKSDKFIAFISRLDSYRVPTLPKLLLGKRARPISKEDSALALRTLGDTEQKDAIAAISIINQRFEFLARIEREALVQFWLKAWLVGHVPLACGSGVLLIIHVVSVLYYGKP